MFGNFEGVLQRRFVYSAPLAPALVFDMRIKGGADHF